ncbi:hypothetical protein ACRE_083440 [Hapsidospora chrysogenum ATCC 11550]|uniref:Uncharacterized protein n=1 Tax=Hapsidospora chrysogenum (strain ATCC 11550 / CBS 779.69 / DSM 880 / IAM 14645 / JCM 23072 / IMI 49137) TaxID=857340 RepID=A0A086SV18_HAPC1|nr:hypothetical protein ACRE_083440 [Hapsidospora chrysogenum ATCC 11550]
MDTPVGCASRAQLLELIFRVRISGLSGLGVAPHQMRESEAPRPGLSAGVLDVRTGRYRPRRFCPGCPFYGRWVVARLRVERTWEMVPDPSPSRRTRLATSGLSLR